MMRDTHSATLEDIERVVKQYVNPDDAFAKKLVEAGGADDWDECGKLIANRIKEESDEDYDDALVNLLYEVNMRTAIRIIIADRFDEAIELEKQVKIKKLKRKRITRKDGLVYYRTLARGYNQQELLFFTARVKRMRDEHKRTFTHKEIYDAYYNFFGKGVRTESSLRNKWYRMRGKLSNDKKLKRRRQKRDR